MTTEDAAALGHFHFPLEHAALCVEDDVQQTSSTMRSGDTYERERGEPVPCNHVFDITMARSGDGSIRCPACGGRHWIMLAESLKRRGSYRDAIENALNIMGDAT